MSTRRAKERELIAAVEKEEAKQRKLKRIAIIQGQRNPLDNPPYQNFSRANL